MKLKTVVYLTLGVFTGLLVLGVLTTTLSVISAPGRVIQETLKTNNIIENYEMFYDLKTGYERRVADIGAHTGLVSDATGAEQNRLKIELAGLQQTCRDLVARYNSASQKMNQNLFKANDLPYELDINTCK